jgi:hypothetical protein
MLLEEVFARIDRERRPEPPDDAGSVIIRRIRELLNLQQFKQSLPSASTSRAEK